MSVNLHTVKHKLQNKSTVLTPEMQNLN